MPHVLFDLRNRQNRLVCRVFALCIATFLAVFFAVCLAKNINRIDIGTSSRDAAWPTLRSMAQQAEQADKWTASIEKNRLETDIDERTEAAQEAKLTPMAMALANVKTPLNLPYIEGFGSLDTTALTNEMRAVLDALIHAINRRDGIMPLMAKGMDLFAIIFMNDLFSYLSPDDAVEAEYGAPDFDGDDAIIKIRLSQPSGAEHNKSIDFFAVLSPENTDAAPINDAQNKLDALNKNSKGIAGKKQKNDDMKYKILYLMADVKTAKNPPAQ